MDIKTFKKLFSSFSPAIAVRMRGHHGIGKSQSVYQAASLVKSDFYKNPDNASKYNWDYEKGLPVVERRISQMTEGDLIGLPKLTDNGTVFVPCDWILDACARPVVLFLDEMNRGLEQVKQMFFQMADSRKFYGFTLHPETRLVIAENIGDQYQVQMNDPAETSRYAIIDLTPSIPEWLEWASENCHPAVVEFIRQDHKALDYEGVSEPNKKYPDRRAWDRLDKELTRSELIDNPQEGLFFSMCMSMIGSDVAARFTDFCKNRDKQVSAKEVLTNWAKAKKRLGNEIPQEKYNEIVGKLEDHLKKLEKDKSSFSKDETVQYAAFMHDCPVETRMNAWGILSNNYDSMISVHPHVKQLILMTVGEWENIQADKEQQKKEEEEKAAAEATTASSSSATTTTKSTKKTTKK